MDSGVLVTINTIIYPSLFVKMAKILAKYICKLKREKTYQVNEKKKRFVGGRKRRVLTSPKVDIVARQNKKRRNKQL